MSSGSDDGDRTIIRPVPGRGRPVPPPAPPAAAPLTTMRRTGRTFVRQAEGTERLSFGTTPLAAAAAPLLQLLARIRRTARPPDVPALRQNAVAALRQFAQEAHTAGAAAPSVTAAGETLAASIDDAVLNTPWGAEGGWAARPLLAELFPARAASDPFFPRLKRLLADPASEPDVLDLMYTSLALGYAGTYRQRPEGHAQLERIRAATYEALARARPTPAGPLARQTRGIDAPWRPDRVAIPLWVGAAACVAVVAGAFTWAALALNAQSDAVYTRMAAATPAAMPHISRAGPVRPPPLPPTGPPSLLAQVRTALAPLAPGLVALEGTQAAPVLRLDAATLFNATGSAPTIAGTALLRQLGAALAPLPVEAELADGVEEHGHGSRVSAVHLATSRTRTAAAILRKAGLPKLAIAAPSTDPGLAITLRAPEAR